VEKLSSTDRPSIRIRVIFQDWPFVHVTKQSIDEQSWASTQGYECAEIKVHAILHKKVLKINEQVHVPSAIPSVKEVPL